LNKLLALLVVLPSAALAQSGNADNGKRVFLKDGCYECHGTVAQGGTGPRLTSPAIPLSTLTAVVRKGVGGMPPYSAKVLSDAELSDIHAYLETIPAPPPAKSIALLNQ
jgi:ubiquinol-cytochrome c reductase cytochrome c subunit